MTKQQKLQLQQLETARVVAHGAWVDTTHDNIGWVYPDETAEQHAANMEQYQAFMAAWLQFCRVYGAEIESARLTNEHSALQYHWVLYRRHDDGGWQRHTPMVGRRPQPFLTCRLLQLYARDNGLEREGRAVAYREVPL